MKEVANSTQMEVGVAFLVLGGLYMGCSIIAGLVRKKGFSKIIPNVQSKGRMFRNSIRDYGKIKFPSHLLLQF